MSDEIRDQINDIIEGEIQNGINDYIEKQGKGFKGQELKVNVSKVGCDPLTDSYIDNTLTTSGIFNDNSSS